METLPVDLTELVGTTLACLMVIIPILGLALRYAARPVVDALLASRGEGARPADMTGLKMRVDALEHEIRQLSDSATTRSLPSPSGEAIRLRP